MNSFRKSNIKRALKNLFLRRKTNVVMLEPRAGLGDTLLCIGLIKALAEKYPDICFYYACIAPNSYHTISWILNEVSNVYPIPVRSGKEAVQLSGFWNCHHWPIGADYVDLKRLDASYYEQFKIPFERRWERRQIKAGPQSNALIKRFTTDKEKYIIACNVASSNVSFNLNIQNSDVQKIIFVHPATNNLCDWIGLMENASEIHTIDTSFIHLVESYFYNSSSHPKLYFHLARPAGTEFTRLLPWHYVTYENNQ